MSGEAHFEVYEAPDGWRWRLRATNGEVVSSGEAYETQEGVAEGIRDMYLAASAAMASGRIQEVKA